MTAEQLEHEFNNDVFITRENSFEKSMMIPTLKAKWVGIKHQQTRLLHALEDKRARLKHTHQVALSGNSKIALAPHEVEKLQIVAKDELRSMDEQIAEYRDTVEYVKDLVQAIMFIGTDVKNIVELRKLEEE
jgi:hypothetical protein